MWAMYLVKMNIKAALGLAVLVCIAFLAYTAVIFKYGSSVGRASTAEQLSKYVVAQQRAALEANEKKAELERRLAEITQEHTATLVELRKEHEASIIDSNRTHASRLQQLGEREARYRQLSEATAAECRTLADLTTRLDRTLTEGRQLVGDLRQELALRNKQLEVIGEQFLAERKR